MRLPEEKSLPTFQYRDMICKQVIKDCVAAHQESSGNESTRSFSIISEDTGRISHND